MTKFKTLTTTVLFTACCIFAVSATAAPGYHVNSFAVMPQNVPTLVAALDKWMATDVAKGFPGRVILNAHVADGADPASHSLVIAYSSMAENEAWLMKAQTSQEYQTLIQSFVSSIDTNHPMQTKREAVVNSWGEADPADTILIVHSITTTDAPSVLAALNGWAASAKSFPGQLQLTAVIAGGREAGSHSLVIAFRNLAEMETWQAENGGSAARLQLLHSLQGLSDYNGAYLLQRVKMWSGASD